MTHPEAVSGTRKCTATHSSNVNHVLVESLGPTTLSEVLNEQFSSKEKECDSVTLKFDGARALAVAFKHKNGDRYAQTVVDATKGLRLLPNAALELRSNGCRGELGIGCVYEHTSLYVNDADQLVALRTSDGAGAKNLERIAPFVSTQLRCWSTHGYGLWVILIQGDSTVTGWCGLRPGDTPLQPEALYGLGSAAQGKGYATEALRAVISFAFSVPGVSSVWAATGIGNTSSVAVMKRAGMLFERQEELDGVDSSMYRINRNGS